MKELNKDQPCPCGSEKEFQYCCRPSNVVHMTSKYYNKELEQFHQYLSDFAIDNFDYVILDEMDDYYPTISDKGETIEQFYMIGLTFWTIINVIFYDEETERETTIFDIFLNNYGQRIKRIGTLNTMKQWGFAVPSVYEVTDMVNNESIVTDLITGETHNITSTNHYEVGKIIIGALIPFVNCYEFLFDEIELSGDNKVKVLDILQQYTVEVANLKETFPYFLKNIAETIHTD